jgi:hypothetical protein
MTDALTSPADEAGRLVDDLKTLLAKWSDLVGSTLRPQVGGQPYDQESIRSLKGNERSVGLSTRNGVAITANGSGRVSIAPRRIVSVPRTPVEKAHCRVDSHSDVECANRLSPPCQAWGSAVCQRNGIGLPNQRLFE